jgi:hypothetical protein
LGDQVIDALPQGCASSLRFVALARSNRRPADRANARAIAELLLPFLRVTVDGDILEVCAAENDGIFVVVEWVGVAMRLAADTGGETN